LLTPVTRLNPIPNSNNQRSMATATDSQAPSNPRSGPLAIALGDPAGIGAEVTLKALAAARWSRPDQQPLLVACRRWLEQSYQQLRTCSDSPLRDPATLEIVDLPLERPARPGLSGPSCGAASFAWLTRAWELVQSGRCRALVTAPIAKTSWHAAGHRYPGQTERLAELAGVDQAAMLFTARSPQGTWRFNTLLATTHIPLAEVPAALSPALIERQLERLLGFCRRFSERPRLVVAGLNPHAGEAGHLGREEIDWLGPCLQAWQQRHPEVLLEGPQPPDSAFLEAAAAWRGQGQAADGFLALYHDQGLIPVKLLAFDRAVNTTLGLPFLRTSPDHGTAFAIAGKGIARSASMEAALETAAELS